MESEHQQPGIPAEGNGHAPPIKRGKGLRLTTSAPLPEEPAAPEAATPPAEMAAAPPPAPPKRRGKGLRLTTSAPLPEEPAAPQAPVPEAPSAATEPDERKMERVEKPAPFKSRVETMSVDEMLRATPARQVRLAHGDVTYRQAGEGPPMLLVHGYGASSRYWIGTLVDLSDLRTCYALDLPGFGESAALSDLGSIDRLADLVIEFADALGLDQFDINGHSFGAAVAISVAARRPARVRSLIVTGLGVRRGELERIWFGLARMPLDVTVRLWQPVISQVEPWLKQLTPLSAKLLSTPPIPQLLAQWYLDSIPSDDRLLREGIIDLTRMGLGAHLACVASIGDPALVTALATVRAPSLFVGGVSDRVAPPEDLGTAAELVEGSRAVVLDRCGHVPMIERPAAYHAVLRDFLLA